MANQANGPRMPQTVRISFQAIRNLTSPEEKESGIATYFANVPVREIDKLSTGHNLRSYIAEHNPRKRNQVHRAIRRTIVEEPQRFINRNSGVTICCSDVEVDEKSKTVLLHNASLINGAQTQGELRGFLDEINANPDLFEEMAEFHVRAEINVDPEEGSVIETAIARNTATSVKSISQAGARGILDDLASNFKKHTGLEITMSETDDDPEAVDTKLLLQLCRLVLPQQFAPSQSDAEILKPYKNKEKCLQEFSEWYRLMTDPSIDDEEREAAAQRYQFTVSIAPRVWAEYEHLSCASSWNGHRLHEDTQKRRAIRRDENKKIVWVAPGILFPMIRALSAFVTRKADGDWIIDKPKIYREEELVSRAVKQFRSYNIDPYVMGRSVGAYEGLATYTETIVQLLEEIQS